MGVGRAGDEVEAHRAQRGHAHAGPAREAAVGRGHERGGLLVSRQDQLDARAAQRLHDVEVFFAGDGEDPIDPLVLERLDEQIGSLHRCLLCARRRV
jgi:hypothetical protein